MDKNVEPQKLIYKFVVPIEVVVRYKNNDVTGQQVFDESVILLDDERIELNCNKVVKIWIMFDLFFLMISINFIQKFKFLL
ncbi:MAG: hypothetical protein SGI89_03055, partial [bacterium]|nr:hypothetical protein [bacterium]